MSLFMYYLFEKAGGMDYSSDGSFIDRGGISFLREMTGSSVYGWKSIVTYFKESTDSLFLEFAENILLKDMNEIFDMDKEDPLTGEKVFSAGEKVPYRFASGYKVLPYSFFCI